MEEELKEKLFNKKKVGWENLDTRRKEEIFNFCKDYMDFLNKAKTEREFIKEAKKIADLNGFKDLSEYDSLSDSAYLRAKEDYLIGINFSRLLSIIYGRNLASKINEERASISVGRVMTCVLGMIVAREREIRNFVKTKYYKIIRRIWR